jgi:propionyl-CoA carboxylase alpha chain
MFSKILIANRGEIACRVMRTAKRMGIATVAVYSEADVGAAHVRAADEAIGVGPGPAASSYLDMDRIVLAARESGAEAVHPGYGFLSENAEFARALEAAGIAFIGPGAEAIRLMGDKIEAKKLARAAGVTTIPGHLGIVGDADEAVRIAEDIGYPVMIKAAAGGGGKGMRVAQDAGEMREGFARAASEASSSFGDGRLFVEKFIAEPRHIEIQVLADGHGNAIHLGERECSIQRRHQKVIEEAPSPALDPETRAAMGAQALALAREVDYRSAGTVEFIVDGERNFYFLEMNTRLQVEHPVTELITGIDLVEQMILIAAGEKLTLTQDDVRLDGWAFEARVYAEDPRRDFLPSVGRLTRYAPPPVEEGVRVDSGVIEGAEVSLFYDPMIAKLCVHGSSRDDALGRLRAALDGFRIEGVIHNLPFLAAVAGHPRFREGRLDTNFIAEEYPEGWDGSEVADGTRDVLVAVAGALHRGAAERAAAGRVGKLSEDYVVSLGAGAGIAIQVRPAQGGCDVSLDGRTLEVRHDWRPGGRLFRGTVDGAAVTVQVTPAIEGYRLCHAGADLAVVVRSPRAAELAARMPAKQVADASHLLRSPMPGLVVSIAVEPGQEVKAGEPLAVVEAMKMENVLRAEHDAVVAQVLSRPGDSLAVDQVILEFEEGAA